MSENSKEYRAETYAIHLEVMWPELLNKQIAEMIAKDAQEFFERESGTEKVNG